MKNTKNHKLEIKITDSLANKSIRDILKIYNLSKKNLHSFNMSKEVMVNDEVVNLFYVCEENDILQLPAIIEDEIDFIPQDLPLEIVYEDDYLLIVNKPSNIDVHPTSKDGLNTLVNGVAQYFKDNNINSKIRYIHRLDRNTTGGVIIAKTYFVHNLLNDWLAGKKINRKYIALVSGSLKKDLYRINAPIGNDRHSKSKKAVSPNGQHAETVCRVLKRFDNYSLVELTLLTGRTHQIRVHMEHIGHPILGDTLYGGDTRYINRQALHAHKLILKHPISFEELIVDIPLPKDIESLIGNN